MTDWEKTWVVDLSWGDATNQIARSNFNNEFDLQAVKQNRDVKAYRVTFSRGSMAPCWADCILFEMGNNPAPKLANPVAEADLSGMTQAMGTKLVDFQTNVDIAMQGGGDALNRLQGNIEVDGVPCLAEFYRIPQSVVPAAGGGNNDLLIVKVTSLNVGDRPDGSGAGHPK